MEAVIRPIHLGPNQPHDRFYRGGDQIAAFRRMAEARQYTPEDWVASVTTLFGEKVLGLTRLEHGGLLVDDIAADPVGWLGSDHVRRWGHDPCLLVKLLDAGERLPVHIHPHRDFAGSHLGPTHGKAEAWLMLKPAVVRLGWVRNVSADELADWVERQDVESMLAATHSMQVEAGDTIFVPPGCPHAIGESAFLVEVQEPSDLSVLLEWRDFAIDGARDGHLGLGFETALQAVDHAELPTECLSDLVVRTSRGASILPAGAREYFRLELYHLGTVDLDPGYSVLVLSSGTGVLTSPTNQWDPVDLTAGDTILVAYAAGSIVAGGNATLVRCRPPEP